MSKSSNTSSSQGSQSQLQNLLSNLTQNQQQQSAQQQQQQSTGTSSQTGTTAATNTGATTATPNNLASLMQAWGLAGNLVNQTSGQAANLANQGLNLIGQGASAAGNAALSGLNQLLGLGQGVGNIANQYLTPIASGAAGAANPFMSQMAKTISNAVQAQQDGRFGASGRYGSGANANAYNSALTREVGNLAYQNYGDAANRQLQAAQQIGTNATNSVNQQIQALLGTSQLGQAATGAGNAALTAGYQPITNFAQILGALGGGGGTTTQAGQTAETTQQAGTTQQNSSLQQLVNSITNMQRQGTTNSSMTGTQSATGQSNTSGFNWMDLFNIL